jgi:hypothetical protein
MKRNEIEMKAVVLGSAVMAVLGGAFVGGCAKNEQTVVTQDGVAENAASATNVASDAAKPNRDFEIPLSLVTRMVNACQAEAQKMVTEVNDVEELMALGDSFLNAVEICARPRGEMKVVNDMLSDAERAKVWPIDFESFEAELEKKLVVDSDGLYRLKADVVKDYPVGDDGLVAVNPTLRYVNHEIEKFAVEQLDRVPDFKRMPEAMFCEMTGDEKMSEGTHSWTVGQDVYFVIQPTDGAWGLREYMFVLWQQGGAPTVLATFDSFPNRKEACAALLFRDSMASLNNLAVMMWRHQCDRMRMDPGMIKTLLEAAVQAQVPAAEANLAVLRAHIKELFEE